MRFERFHRPRSPSNHSNHLNRMNCIVGPYSSGPSGGVSVQADVLAALTVGLFIVQPRKHSPKITSKQRLR